MVNVNNISQSIYKILRDTLDETRGDNILVLGVAIHQHGNYKKRLTNRKKRV